MVRSQTRFFRRAALAGTLTAALSAAPSAGLLPAVPAAPATPPPELPLSFETIESVGPDSRSVLCVMQDSQGFIWAGTVEGGLLRYNGRGAVKFSNDPANPASLPGGRISALYNDAQGRIWVGTDEGLARYEADSNSFTRFLPRAAAPGAAHAQANTKATANASSNADLNARIVRRIISDGAGGMWLGTWGGLQHFDPASGAFRLYQADPARPDALAHNDVNAVAVDKDGGVWAATWPAGIDYLAPGKSGFTHLRLDDADAPDPKLNDVRSMRVAGDGTLWLGSDAGVVVWRPGTPWSQRRRLPGPAGRINNLDLDSSGAVWASTRTEGLQRWDAAAQRFQPYLHRAEDGRSLPSNAINAAVEDRNGTLWVASFTDGLSRANMGNYGFVRIVPRDVAPQSFPSSNFIRSISKAPGGRLWLGVDDGLALFDPAGRRIERKYTAQPGQAGALSHNSVYSLYQQPDGPLWIGTSKGMNRLDPDQHGQAGERFAVVRFGQASDNFINTIRPGKGGVLWVGTGASLIRYEPASGAARHYRHSDVDPASRAVDDASVVLEDSQGRLWVGDFLRGGGLDMMDVRGGAAPDGVFRHFRHAPANPTSISSDKVTCLYEDMHGTIWIGTVHGLNRLLPAADGSLGFRRYLGAGDPGAVQIEAIESDQAGILWISTAKGLSRLDPSSGAFSHYTSDDGLTDGLYLGSSARASDGKLYFGAATGIAAVYPELPLRAPGAPQVAITDIRIFDRSLDSGRRPERVLLDGPVTAPRALTLPWNASVLTLEFAALHYAAPKHNGYAYWLEGFDTQWVLADASHPLATYTNLYPGNYRFHLRATSNKGLASAEIVLPITVTPPYWQTWWFRAGAVLLVALLVVAAYRVRVRALTRRARRLEALVARRTQELELSNQKLQALSATDGLTCLANRRCFDDALAREWARAKRTGEPLALAMLDVDYFKKYNDHYGHQAGDACLREVARVLADGLHRATDLAARYGGEEFVFIAPAITAEQAEAIADKVRAALQALALPHEHSPFGCVTISVGVACMTPTEQQTSDQLVRRADQALYEAKRNGRNRVTRADTLSRPAA